ncbi:MAG: FAD-dependent thymidylate synthase [Desulforhopalus sp.]
MKIVEPSFEIQHHLDSSSISARLEACARVCYKSEDNITDTSAIPFLSKIVDHGHDPVLEMAVVSFEVTCHVDHVLELFSCHPQYLVIDRIDSGVLITGSIRAFKELYSRHFHNQLINDLVSILAAKEPHLFGKIFDPDKALEPDSQVAIKKLTLQDVEKLPEHLMLRHRFVSVKFIVNRAISHELVRHRPCSFLQESQRYCRYGLDKFDNQVTFIQPVFFSKGTEEYTQWVEAMELTEAKYLKLLETSTPQAARTVLPNSCKTEIIVYGNLIEWQHIFKLRTAKDADPSMREIMLPLHQEMQKRFSMI